LGEVSNTLDHRPKKFRKAVIAVMAMHRLQKLVTPKSEADASRSPREELKVDTQADELEPNSDLEDVAQS
jgi:hypothetical protein